MRRVGFIAFQDFHSLSLSTLSVFEGANRRAQTSIYELHILSENGGPVRTSGGLSLETEPFDDSRFDTLMVLGTLLEAPTFSAALIRFVSDAAKRARRVASICTGALILAEAGLLDDHRATTHWAYAKYFRERFPRVRLEEDRIFVIDGSIWTSAGCTACVDLALAMVEIDEGRELAQAVAKDLVIYHRREGRQRQHSALLELEARSDRIQHVLEYARRNLRAPLTTEQLAQVAHLSPRQFRRAFQQATGQSPARAVENLRIEMARAMVEDGRCPIDVIAREAGFGSRERMRRAFVRRLGQPPQEIRREARNEMRPGEKNDRSSGEMQTFAQRVEP